MTERQGTIAAAVGVILGVALAASGMYAGYAGLQADRRHDLHVACLQGGGVWQGDACRHRGEGE